MICIYNIKNGNFRVTSPYGQRMLNGVSTWHSGVDLVCDTTKELVACTEGVIAFSGIILDKNNLTWQWGNYVVIQDNNGIRYYYCHMAKTLVKTGQKVKKGDLIGVEGSTGYSFGSHCHFEIRKNNSAINPCEFLGIDNKVAACSYNLDEPAVPVVTKPTAKKIPVKVKIPQTAIKINDKVKMTGAKWATGQNVPDFVLKGEYIVQKIDGKKALIGINLASTGWANIKDLKLV